MTSLQEFHQNVDLRENVRQYLYQQLEALAVEKVFERQDVSGIADAKEAIDRAFEEMDKMFSKTPEPKVVTSR